MHFFSILVGIVIAKKGNERGRTAILTATALSGEEPLRLTEISVLRLLHILFVSLCSQVKSVSC